MAYPALSVAKHMLEASGWRLTNLQLQKLLYIAHMLWLGERGEPLVEESFEAWDYGPVVPVVYHRAKCFGARAIRWLDAPSEIDDPDVREHLDDVVNKLGGLTGGQLVAITHWNKGAWAKRYRPELNGLRIANDLILQEYRDRFKEDD